MFKVSCGHPLQWVQRSPVDLVRTGLGCVASKAHVQSWRIECCRALRMMGRFQRGTHLQRSLNISSSGSRAAPPGRNVWCGQIEGSGRVSPCWGRVDKRCEGVVGCCESQRQGHEAQEAVLIENISLAHRPAPAAASVSPLGGGAGAGWCSPPKTINFPSAVTKSKLAPAWRAVGSALGLRAPRPMHRPSCSTAPALPPRKLLGGSSNRFRRVRFGAVRWTAEDTASSHT